MEIKINKLQKILNIKFNDINILMESWNKLSTLLLETNHIRIPIEKRFFLSFLDVL